MAWSGETASRVGPWSSQAVGKINPGQGINFVISGPVESTLVPGDEGVSTVSASHDTGSLYLVGLGLRKDTGYLDSLLNCQEVWIPFKDENTIHRVVLKVGVRSSYPNWIYLWAPDTTDDNKIDRSWILAGDFTEYGAYNEYSETDGSIHYEFDYNVGQPGPGNILFIPYIHPNYLSTDNYNAVLGNAMETAETPYLYTILQNDVKDGLGRYVNPNLRYKNYIQDEHKTPFIGGIHTGEFNIPGGDLSRVVEQDEYFKSFTARAEEFNSSASLQTLDLSYMSYRAISASVYVDRYEGEAEISGSPLAVPIEKVWEDLQGGNTDDPETVYFVNTASYGTSSIGSGSIISEKRTSIPVSGSILFSMDGHTAVRITKATVYAPFLNTVYRTGEYGEITELCTGSAENS